jgi:hypothetical protein
MAEMLFEGYPDPPAPDPPVELTSHEKRRRTIENRRARWAAAIAAGKHPLNGRPLLDASLGHTCGDCVHRFLRPLGRPYPKCDLGPLTGGPATDVQARWPACVAWEPKAPDGGA